MISLFDQEDISIAAAVDKGVLEFSGMSAEGEPIYDIDMEKAKNVFPEFYQDLQGMHQDAYAQAIIDGVLDADFSTLDSPQYILTEFGKERFASVKDAFNYFMEELFR